MLQRVAHFCYRRRWLVLGVWVALLVVLSGLSAAFGGVYRDEFSLPGSESQDAFDALEERGFAGRAGFGGQVVVQNPDGFDDPQVQAGLDQLFTDLEDAVPESTVQQLQVGPRAGGTIAFAQIDLADRDSKEYEDAGTAARNVVNDTEIPGTEVELGGDIFVEPQEFASEAFGLLAAIVVLLIAFGSVLAMGLPIMTALFGIGTGIALVGLVVQIIDMPSFSEQAVMMIGIGVGIDYALFIVTRYREGLHEDLTPENAVCRAIDTAGRAVLFAGTTVIIAVLGLFTMGLSMMNGLAVGIALGVLMTMLGSVTLLPAVLGFVGHNIDKLGLPHRKRREGTDHESIWYRWSQVIQRRPWPPLIIGAAALLLLAVPVFSLRLGFGDAGNRPTSDTTRRAFDLVSEGFGPGTNGPFQVVVETSDPSVAQGLRADLEQAEGVSFVTPPESNEAGDTELMMLFPETAPQDKATTDLVNRLRDDVIPGAVGESDTEVLVGGSTPAVVDFAEYMGERLPWFIGVVLVMSFVLLTMVFRSVLVPLKAVVMNLISIGAAYGLLVAVFQWGWGLSLLGLDNEGPIDAWIPMMLFAVVFGLSMDYEVFLLSRVREEYDRTGDNATAVSSGLASTARVITAAAAIMVCVFGAFALGDFREIKMFGIGLAAAVFLDATIVRVVLVPATMELLGDRNWWVPRWLDRILPRIHVEASEDVVACTAPELHQGEPQPSVH